MQKRLLLMARLRQLVDQAVLEEKEGMFFAIHLVRYMVLEGAVEEQRALQEARSSLWQIHLLRVQTSSMRAAAPEDLQARRGIMRAGTAALAPIAATSSRAARRWLRSALAGTSDLGSPRT